MPEVRHDPDDDSPPLNESDAPDGGWQDGYDVGYAFGWKDGASAGAAVAFGLMGMAEAIRERLFEEAWGESCASSYEDEEDAGYCVQCDEPYELVRPGKSQPTCDCYEPITDNYGSDGSGGW